MTPIWFWKIFGVRKLAPDQPLIQPISDVFAIAAYEQSLTDHQNKLLQNGFHHSDKHISYKSNSVSAPLWRI